MPLCCVEFSSKDDARHIDVNNKHLLAWIADTPHMLESYLAWSSLVPFAVVDFRTVRGCFRETDHSNARNAAAAVDPCLQEELTG